MDQPASPTKIGNCICTFREGLLPAASTLTEGCLDLEDIVVGEGRASPALPGRVFSCELGGSRASLLGTGVDSFFLAEEVGFALGRELALVVSFKQVESGETFDNGEDAGPGEDFWKNDMIDRCFADDEAELRAMALAGVRAAPAEAPADPLPAMISADSRASSRVQGLEIRCRLQND
jgi:hypothetical protein